MTLNLVYTCLGMQGVTSVITTSISVVSSPTNPLPWVQRLYYIIWWCRLPWFNYFWHNLSWLQECGELIDYWCRCTFSLSIFPYHSRCWSLSQGYVHWSRRTVPMQPRPYVMSGACPQLDSIASSCTVPMQPWPYALLTPGTTPDSKLTDCLDLVWTAPEYSGKLGVKPGWLVSSSVVTGQLEILNFLYPPCHPCTLHKPTLLEVLPPTTVEAFVYIYSLALSTV